MEQPVTNIMINAVDHPYNSFYVWEQLYDKAGNPIEGAYVDQNGDNKIRRRRFGRLQKYCS